MGDVTKLQIINSQRSTGNINQVRRAKDIAGRPALTANLDPVPPIEGVRKNPRAAKAVKVGRVRA